MRGELSRTTGMYRYILPDGSLFMCFKASLTAAEYADAAAEAAYAEALAADLPDPDDDPDSDGYGWERRALRGVR